MTTGGLKPSYVDLFAGCGGLSLGLEWAGFRRAGAIEISPDAARSYHHNLICREDTSSYQWSDLVKSTDLQVAVGLIVGDIAGGFDALVSSCRQSSAVIDLVAAGPPCQGFSVAGRRNPHDPRNALIDHVVEAATSLRPTLVLVENVPAIDIPFTGHEHRESSLGILSARLAEQAYVPSVFRLRSSMVGVPQDRIRLFLLGIRRDYFDLLPVPLRLMWRAEDALADLIKPASHAPTVHQALFDIGPAGYRFHHRSDYLGFPYAKSLRFARELAVPTMPGTKRLGRDELRNHELRNHKPDTTARFRLYLRLKKLGLSGRLLNRATTEHKDQIASQVREGLARHGVHADEAVTLATELTDVIFKYRTKKHSQIVLAPDYPARTITTLPDDLIHYEEPRVLSVRELARLQSFPDSFVFKGRPTTGGLRRRSDSPQYSQVGNAVPPIMAREVGRLVKSILHHVTARPAITAESLP
jgi:DNA (cytosine-5)-methyltransferase 1